MGTLMHTLLADQQRLRGEEPAEVLTPAQLAMARHEASGRVWGVYVTTEPGRPEVEHCAPEGGIPADPVPSGSVLSMRRYRRVRATAGLALALAVAGYVTVLLWPAIGA